MTEFEFLKAEMDRTYNERLKKLRDENIKLQIEISNLKKELEELKNDKIHN